MGLGVSGVPEIEPGSPKRQSLLCCLSGPGGSDLRWLIRVWWWPCASFLSSALPGDLSLSEKGAMDQVSAGSETVGSHWRSERGRMGSGLSDSSDWLLLTPAHHTQHPRMNRILESDGLRHQVHRWDNSSQFIWFCGLFGVSRARSFLQAHSSPCTQFYSGTPCRHTVGVDIQ